MSGRREELGYAFVRDLEVASMRQVFIRLVKPGESTPADTIDAENAMIDLDEQGRVIGVTVFWRT